ncbi:MAG: hypothetical protein KBF88_15190, partial [Polyangiaceae bacterium]|nr:hypothetical protein [Polyangiaceae bacterium]
MRRISRTVPRAIFGEFSAFADVGSTADSKSGQFGRSFYGDAFPQSLRYSRPMRTRAPHQVFSATLVLTLG